MLLGGKPKYIVVPIAVVLFIFQLIAVVFFMKEAVNRPVTFLLVAGFILNIVFLFFTFAMYFRSSSFPKPHWFIKGFFAVVIINICVLILDGFDQFLSLASPSVFTWVCILILFATKDLEFQSVSKLGIYEVTKK